MPSSNVLHKPESRIGSKVLEAQPVEKDKKDQDRKHERNKENKISVLSDHIQNPHARERKQFRQHRKVQISERNNEEENKIRDTPHSSAESHFVFINEGLCLTFPQHHQFEPFCGFLSSFLWKNKVASFLWKNKVASVVGCVKSLCHGSVCVEKK